jgi:hypothetical protein
MPTMGLQNRTSKTKANHSTLSFPNQKGIGSPLSLIPIGLKIEPTKTHVMNTVKRMPPTNEPSTFLFREIFPFKGIP